MIIYRKTIENLEDWFFLAIFAEKNNISIDGYGNGNK